MGKEQTTDETLSRVGRLREVKTGRWAGNGLMRREMMGLFAGVTCARQRRWLAAYLVTGEIREACRIAGFAWPNHYRWLDQHPNYAAAFEKAKEIVADWGEDEVHRRAFRGVMKPVTFQGVITDAFLEYSDTLALGWLKANRPTKYRDSLIGLTANAPAGISIVLIGGEAMPSSSKQSIEGPGDACLPIDMNTDKSNTYDKS